MKNLKFLFVTSWLLFLSFFAYTQTTYTWNATSGGDYAIATNWTPIRTTPATNDVLQFTDGGTYTVTNITTQTIGQLFINNSTKVTFSTTASRTLSVTGAANTNNFIIDESSSLTLSSSVSQLQLLLSAAGGNQLGEIAGTLTIGNNTRLTNNNQSTNLVKVKSGGRINHVGNINTGANPNTLEFENGSIYDQTGNGLGIPFSIWGATSQVIISGLTNGTPSQFNQDFGNFLWDAPGQNAEISPATLPTNVRGIFEVRNTNGQILSVAGGGGNTSRTWDGDFLISGGRFSFRQNSVGGTRDLSVKDFTIDNTNNNQAQFVFNNTGATGASGASTLTVRRDLTITLGQNSAHTSVLLYRGNTYTETITVGRNFTQSGSSTGNISRLGTGGTTVFTFNGSTTQTVSLARTDLFGSLNEVNFNTNGTVEVGTNTIAPSVAAYTVAASATVNISNGNIGAGGNFTLNGTLNIGSGSVSNSGTFTVASGATLALATGKVNNTGNFTLNSGATISIGSPQGIVAGNDPAPLNGNVQNGTTTRTFNTGANYIYTGADGQVTGSGLPTGNITGVLTINLSSATDRLNATNSISLTRSSNIGLTLTRGILVLGSNNISLANSTTVSGGSANSFVATNSTGEFRRAFTTGNPAAFTYPLGDITGTFEYSPITLTLSSVTGTTNTLGVKVTDAEHPNKGSINLLSRYWSFNTVNGLTGYNYSAVFTSLASDGTPEDAIRYTGSGTIWNTVSTNVGASPFTVSSNLATHPLTSDFTTTKLCLSNTWTGNVSSDWETPSNWSCNTVPNATTDAIIPNVSPKPFPVTPIVGIDNTVSVKSVTIESGASVNVQANTILEVYGNFTNNSGATIGNGKLKFAGSVAQTLTGNTNIGVVILDNTTGVNISNNTTVNISDKLQLDAGVLTIQANADVVLKSTPSKTAYVDDFNDAIGATNANTGITGEITIERYVPLATLVNSTFPHLSRFHYIGALTGGTANKWSSQFAFNPIPANLVDGTPVTPRPDCSLQFLASNSAYSNLFSFNEANVTGGFNTCALRAWEARTTNASTPRGKGFAARINDPAIINPDRIISEKGTYQNSSLSGITLSITAANLSASRGEHLVANPFWAPIDWNEVTGTNLDGTAYRYNPNTGTFNPFNQISGSGLFSTNEAFVVLPLNNNQSSYTINLPATARRNSNNNEFRRRQQNYIYGLNISIVANGEEDKTLIAFDNLFTDAYDNGYDARKINSNSGVPTLYTRNAQNERSSILAIAEATQQVIIPLGVKAEFNGNHTFTFNGINDFPVTSIIWLEDLKTNTIQYLRQNNVYTFIGDTTDNIDRFLLHFAPELLFNATSNVCNNTEGKISITERGGLDWNYELKDANNNIVSSGNFGNTTFDIQNLADGTYTLALTNTISGYQTSETLTIQTSTATVDAEVLINNNTITVGDSIIIDGSNSTGNTSTNIDAGDGTVYNNETVVTHTYTTPGTYTVTVFANNDDCSDIATVIVTVNDVATVIVTNSKYLNVYSNENALYVSQGISSEVLVTVEMYNLVGQLVVAKDIIATGHSTYTIALDNIANGVYVAKVTTNDITVSKRVLVNK